MFIYCGPKTNKNNYKRTFQQRNLITFNQLTSKIIRAEYYLNLDINTCPFDHIMKRFACKISLLWFYLINGTCVNYDFIKKLFCKICYTYVVTEMRRAICHTSTRNKLLWEILAICIHKNFFIYIGTQNKKETEVLK